MLNPIIQRLVSKRPSDEEVEMGMSLAVGGSDADRWAFVVLNAHTIAMIVMTSPHVEPSEANEAFCDAMYGFKDGMDRFKYRDDLTARSNFKLCMGYCRAYARGRMLQASKLRRTQLTLGASAARLPFELSLDSLPHDVRDASITASEPNESDDELADFLLGIGSNAELGLTPKQAEAAATIASGDGVMFHVANSLGITSSGAEQRCRQVAAKLLIYASRNAWFEDRMIALASRMSTRFGLEVRNGIAKAKERVSELEGRALRRAAKSKTLPPETIAKLRETQLRRIGVSYEVLDPHGRAHRIDHGMDGFCREHGLVSRLMLDVVKGRRGQHKGWTCPSSGYAKGDGNLTKTTLLSPDGVRHETPNGVKAFCAEMGLDYNGILKVICGTRRGWRGWTRP